MIENQTFYVNKISDKKQEYSPILVEIGVLSTGDWRSLQRRSTLLSLLSFDANNLFLSFYTSGW